MLTNIPYLYGPQKGPEPSRMATNPMRQAWIDASSFTNTSKKSDTSFYCTSFNIYITYVKSHSLILHQRTSFKHAALGLGFNQPTSQDQSLRFVATTLERREMQLGLNGWCVPTKLLRKNDMFIACPRQHL